MTSPASIPPIPIDTNQAAKSVYSRDNFFLLVGDRLDKLLADVDLEGSYPARLVPRRESPSLAMVTIFQFVELLSDAQAAESTRARVDWQYALHLSLNYLGLARNALCPYRQWILQETGRLQDFQRIIDRLGDARLVVGNHGEIVVAANLLYEVCSITRFDNIFRAMENALGTLAIQQPGWLQNISLPHWYTRFRDVNALNHHPLGRADRIALTESIGADAYYLLGCYARDAQPGWASTQDIRSLHRVWLDQFEHLPTCQTNLMERCSFCGAMPEEETPSHDPSKNSSMLGGKHSPL